MDFRQLRYFVAIVEAGSITEAARALNVVQPAVSQRLADLERALGVQLLVRTRQGISATSAGTELYGRACSILKQVNVAANATRERGGIVGGRVSIGLLHSLSRSIAVPLFKALHAKFPSVVPEIIVDYSAPLARRVDSTTLDLALRVVRPDERVSGFTPVLADSLWLVGSPRVLKGKNEALTIQDLGSVPLLVSPSQPIHNELQLRAQEAGVSLNIIGSIDTSFAIEELCRSGHGATFLSEMTARSMVTGSGRKLMMVKIKGHERTIGIYCHPDVPLTSSIRSCREILRDVLRQMHAGVAATRT